MLAILVLPLIALVWIQVIYVTMVYGPIAAYLVELFPAKIRYTSLSVPYHLGNGWFGGFTPLIATSPILPAATDTILALADESPALLDSKAIKARHSAELMGVPHVVGHAISTDTAGNPVIAQGGPRNMNFSIKFKF